MAGLTIGLAVHSRKRIVVTRIQPGENMDTKSWIELATAISTSLLACGTFALAWLTRKLEKAWFTTSSHQIGVATWLELERRFDSEEMKRARKKLAQQLKAYTAAKHGKVSETVLDFFEDVGTTYKEGYLNRKLADSAFGFYACRWWEAAKAYVDHEQNATAKTRRSLRTLGPSRSQCGCPAR